MANKSIFKQFHSPLKMPKAKDQPASFKSYIASNGRLPSSRPNERLPQEPSLLPGEVEIGKAEHVLRFIPYSERKTGILGTFYVTNFKVTFKSDDVSQTDENYQRNKLYSEHDIVLNNISAVHQVSKSKRKRLLPGTSIGQVKVLEIQCKDFRIHTFSFKHAAKDESKKVTQSLVHHAFPTRLDLLFAFACGLVDETPGGSPNKRNTYPIIDQPSGTKVGNISNTMPRLEKTPSQESYINSDSPRVPSFTTEEDWVKELTECLAVGYRPVDCNKGFNVTHSLPECVVLPNSLDPGDVQKIANQYTDYRLPVWCYSYNNGAALVRMSHLIPDTLQKDLDSKLTEMIRESHPNKNQVELIDLSDNKNVPSIKDIQGSYEKLKELTMPVTLKEDLGLEVGFNSAVENSRWLHNIQSCLRMARKVTDYIDAGMSVILQENRGTDLCPLISSLSQLLVEPRYRTIQGFQTLVEKEWVALGHNFCDRLGLLDRSETEEAPVFLLFLDCVWQLSQIFPSAFEFSETYLATLWDCACSGLFENFIFPSVREHYQRGTRYSQYGASKGRGGLMNVWDWSWQFGKEELSLFNNPLYKVRTEIKLDLDDTIQLPETENKNINKSPGKRGRRTRKAYSRALSFYHERAPKEQDGILRPNMMIPTLRIWSYCYLRWLSTLQIIAGGSPSEYVQQCLLVEEILLLQHQVRSMESDVPFRKSHRPDSSLLFSCYTADTHKRWSHALTSSFPYRTPPVGGYHGNKQAIMAYLESSLLLEEGEDADEWMEDSDMEKSIERSSEKNKSPLELATGSKVVTDL